MDLPTAATLEIDVGHISSELSLHEMFAVVLRFPGWHGKNFDALWDSLSDPEQSYLPEILLLRSFDILEERLGERAAILRHILADLPSRRPVTVIACDEAGQELARWSPLRGSAP
jgi:RNAse (barnase) inhibitor barstar